MPEAIRVLVNGVCQVGSQQIQGIHLRDASLKTSLTIPGTSPFNDWNHAQWVDFSATLSGIPSFRCVAVLDFLEIDDFVSAVLGKTGVMQIAIVIGPERNTHHHSPVDVSGRADHKCPTWVQCLNLEVAFTLFVVGVDVDVGVSDSADFNEPSKFLSLGIDSLCVVSFVE